MSNQFAETLGEAADNALPREAVFQVLGLQFLQTLTLIAPVGIFLGILLSLARFNRDSEMSALAACGIGPAALLRPIGFLSLLAAAGVGWLALVKAPEASRTIEDIRYRATEQSEFGALTPNGFTAIDSGATVIHAREVDGNHLRGVFFERETDDKLLIVIAEEGERIVDGKNGELSLQLRNGRLYQGRPGDKRFDVVEFEEQGIPIDVGRAEREDLIASHSTSSLIAARDPMSRAELEWRIAAPVSILLLAVLAVPLARSSPREGKYARVGLGLLLYIIYANTLSMARLWVEQETVGSWFGIWCVHVALGLLAIVMLAQQSGAGAPRRRGMIRREPTG